MKKLNLLYIKEQRLKKRISLREMSKILGFKSASTYLQYERGEYAFKANQLPMLADVFECDIQDFFE